MGWADAISAWMPSSFHSKVAGLITSDHLMHPAHINPIHSVDWGALLVVAATWSTLPDVFLLQCVVRWGWWFLADLRKWHRHHQNDSLVKVWERFPLVPCGTRVSWFYLSTLPLVPESWKNCIHSRTWHYMKFITNRRRQTFAENQVIEFMSDGLSSVVQILIQTSPTLGNIKVFLYHFFLM
jgi:cytochrome c oxidase subunit IV